MESLSLLKIDKQDFKNERATLVGAASNSSRATANIMMDLLTNHYIVPDYKHRSKGSHIGYLQLIIIYNYFLPYIAASTGTARSNLPAAMRFSPVKKIKSPRNVSMLPLDAMPRLPSVCPWCLQWFFCPLDTHMLSYHHFEHKFYKKYKLIQETSLKKYSNECLKLNVQGRLRNNIKALECKDRDVIPARRGKKSQKNMSDHVWCTICKNVVTKKGLKDSHLTKCALSKKLTISSVDHQEITKNAVAVVEPEAETIKRMLEGRPMVLQEVLFDLRNDRLVLTTFVLDDPVAQALVTRMASVGRGKNTWIAKIRLRLRLLYKVLTYFQTVYGDKCKSVLDMMHYDLWHAPVKIHSAEYPALVAACYHVCGKREGANTFESCNDVMAVSSLFQRVADIIINQIHHSAEMLVVWRTQTKFFGDFMISDAWKDFTVKPAARQKAMDNNFESIQVPHADFKYYLGHVEEKARVAMAALRAAWEKRDRPACIRALAIVIEVLPLAIGTFSYRRTSEPFRFRKRNVLTRPRMAKLLKDHSHVITPGADEEINKFGVVESKGKGDNPVLTVAKNEFLDDMDFLCDMLFRNFVGVDDENDFVFPNLRSKDGMGHAHPSRCQAKYSKQCEGHVSNYKLLRARYFRTTFATNLCGMNLTYNTKKLMCALMGHSLVVHEQYYNVPQPLQMAAYMGYACQASAEGRIRDMARQTLEEQVDKCVPTNKIPENAKDM